MSRFFIFLYLLGSVSLRGQVFPGQNGLILASNYDSDQPIFYLSAAGERVLAPVAGTLVQVLGGPDAGSLLVLTNSFSQTDFTLAEPGFFDGKSAVVPGVQPLELAYFQIRAWRGDSTWEAAQRNPAAFIGASEVFQDQVGTAAPQPFPFPLNHAPSFTIEPVPEVATELMAALGAIFLWLYRRNFADRSSH